MKTTRATMSAASWDALWTEYCNAKRSGDEARLSNAKANVRIWHVAHKAPVPSWAE